MERWGIVLHEGHFCEGASDEVMIVPVKSGGRNNGMWTAWMKRAAVSIQDHRMNKIRRQSLQACEPMSILLIRFNPVFDPHHPRAIALPAIITITLVPLRALDAPPHSRKIVGVETCS